MARRVPLRSLPLLSARIALCAAAAAILGACSGGPSGDPPPPGPAADASTKSEPSAPARRFRQDTPLESETGKGEILTGKYLPEVWVPDVAVHYLAVHRSSLYWSDASGVHERPFDGAARSVLPGLQATHLVADDDGVVFAVATGPKGGFEVQQISADNQTPRRIARMACSPVQLAPAQSFVVVASTCGIFAVPRQGGAPRQLEAETHRDVSIAADRDRACYMNDHRLSCRSLVDSKEKPVVLDALRPTALRLERLVLFALEEGRLADVPIDGDYGRLVRWEVTSGARWVLTNKQFETHALHLDTWNVYYGTGAGSIRRVAKNGSEVQTLYNAGRQETPRIAIGADHLYFVTYSEPGIHRFRLAPE